MIAKTMNVVKPQRKQGKPSNRPQALLDNPNFDLTDGVLTHALKDAKQATDGDLRQEALAWLWVCCPDIADDLELPTPDTAAIQPDITEYLQRYSTFSLA